MSNDFRDQPVVVVERSEGGLGSFLFGLTIGAGLALLFAPRTGEETRRELKEQGKRLRDAAQDTMDDLQETLGGRYEHVKETVEDRLENAKEMFEDRKERAVDAVDAGKAAVKSARSELEKRLADSKKTKTATKKKSSGEQSTDEE